MGETLTAAFERLGGEFVTPPAMLAERLGSIGAVLFDWDGVFNDGFKPGDEGSPFSEVDSMGANLLRFALWKRTGAQPVTGIITGEKNPRAAAFGAREHVHEVISLAKNKGRAFDGFCERRGIEPARVLFFYDDVLDLDVARRCGVRMMIGRNSAPLLRQFARGNGLADYITAHSGGQHGLREACELVIGLLGLYDEVVAQRMAFAGPYQAYLAERQAIATQNLQG